MSLGMDIKIERLNIDNFNEYEEFLFKEIPYAVIHHSIGWMRILEKIVKAEPVYLIARTNAKILAVFPLALKKKDGLSVINSLPLSGSLGGIILPCKMAASDQEKISLRLIKELENISAEHNGLSYTVIQTPLAPLERKDYIRLIKPDYIYDRITQYQKLNED